MDDLYNAYITRLSIPGAATGPLAGRTVAVKDNISTCGCPTSCGSRILAGYVPPVRRPRGRAREGGRRRDQRQDQHGRVRHGHHHRELGLRPDPQPARRLARPGRLLGRLRGRRGRRARRPRARHGHRRLGPLPGRVLRHRGPEADVRESLAVRPRRVRELARDDRAHGEDRGRRLGPPPRHLPARPARHDHAGPAVRARPRGRRERASASACPRSSSARAWTRAWPRASGPPSRRSPAAAPRSSRSRCRPCATRSRPTT